MSDRCPLGYLLYLFYSVQTRRDLYFYSTINLCIVQTYNTHVICPLFSTLAGMKDEFKEMRANLDTALGDFRAVIGQQNQLIAGTINAISSNWPCNGSLIL